MNENKTAKTGLQILVEEYQAKQYPTRHGMYERMLALLAEERALEAERVGEVVIAKGQIYEEEYVTCDGKYFSWDKVAGKKGSLIFRPEVER